MRNRSRSGADASAAAPQSMPTFSQLERMHSADGFLMVDNKPPDEENSTQVDDDDEDEVSHLSLEQTGVDESISDIEKDLEELVIPDDEEEGEQPRPKPVGVGKGSAEKPWHQGSQEVYEQQLELLQEQLTKAMIDNQTLQGQGL